MSAWKKPRAQFSAQHRAGAGPKSHSSSIGKGTNAWSSTRRKKMGKRKGGH
jgi:hypothetical protein